MSKLKYREAAELFAAVAVVVSLIFVGLELRQSTIASRASAYQEIGIATSEFWYILATNPRLSDIFYAVNEGGVEAYEELSASDRQLWINMTVGSLRAYETVYLQVEQGLLEPEALTSLGYEGLRNSEAFTFMWDDIKVHVDTSFATYIENSRVPER